MQKSFSKSDNDPSAETTDPARVTQVPFCRRYANLWTAAFGILLLFEIVKVGLFMGSGQRPLDYDTAHYWGLGNQIASGDLFQIERACTYRPPVYPAFLAVFQVCFGKHALSVATASQHLMLFGISLITVYTVYQITSSKSASLLALGLSVLCVSQHCLAQTCFADTLLTLWIALTGLLLGLWYQRPSMSKVVALGIVIGLGMLTKPVFLYLVFAPLLLFLSKAEPNRRLLEFAKPALSLLAVTFLVALPWLGRNQYCFGGPFLSKFQGKALWYGCHITAETHPFLFANLSFAQGPHTHRIMEAIEGAEIDQKNPFEVHRTLVERGYGHIEAEDMLLAASLESIKEHPRQYATTFICRAGYFYMKPPSKGQFWRYQKTPVGKHVLNYPHLAYSGQEPWWSEKLAKTLATLIDHLWYPSELLYGASAVMVILSWIYLMVRGPLRPLYLVYMGILLYFSLVSAIVIPLYRFRAPLEPLMIILIASAAGTFFSVRKSSDVPA